MESPSNDRGALVNRIVTTLRGLRKVAIVLVTALVAIGLAGGAAAQASTPTYSITDLGTLGSFSTDGFGINVNAQIVGQSDLQQTVPVPGCPRHHTCTTHVSHAFRYSAGVMTDLGTLGGAFSSGRAVNPNGDVAGSSTFSGTDLFAPTHAFLFSNGHMTDLGTLGGFSSKAHGINSFGEVVGDSYNASGQNDAFLYSGGTMTDLGALGALGSSANGINKLHQVVGSSEAANGRGMHAFRWSNGRMTDLGTLGGDQSIAYAINDVGQIVGYASPPNRSVHAFLYSGGKMTDLGVFFDSSVAEAINNSGVVVGSAYVLNRNGTTDFHAFIYTGGKLQDLNNLIPSGSGWVLREATGINDTGQIVGNGSNPSGYGRAFLLNLH